MKNKDYEIGKNGTYEEVHKLLKMRSSIDTTYILLGIRDRKDEALVELIESSITLEDMCIIGNLRLVHKKFYNRISMNSALYSSCVGGHMKIVKLMIENGANDWNSGLYGACFGGNLDLVKLMIEKGANNWDYGLEGACRGGHLDAIKYIGKGANNWDCGLKGACIGGNLDIVKYMIQKGSNDFDTGFWYALFLKHWSVVEHLIILGSTKYVPKTNKGYYEYLANKLNKPRQQECHGIYEVLSNLILLYQ